ncbi:hypothetical protein Taro_026678 [Colocasia esculenta]|uniref:CCHC-type domain-containing protein n=1 Tax=Colocasia esculenta TaxID=4460 RepID=A0A843VK95_COLES|nr:hypothetical protein [Colocasia esculenta]
MDLRGYMPEGHSMYRPPYFDGSNYTYWKTRMQIFLRAQNHQIWKVVSSGPYELPQDEERWTIEQIKKSNANWSAMNIMHYSLHQMEFSRVSSCATAKEVWDRLMVIYEGTSEVKETKANMLIFVYEAFKMENDETISEMYGRLTLLTNGLKNLGKTFTEYELVRKILRSLTPIWHTKAIVVEESRNLSTTTVDQLIGSLMTYELGLKRTDDDVKKKKSLALKSSPSVKESTEEEESSSSENDSNESTLLTRKFRKFLRKEGKGFLKRRPQVDNSSKQKQFANKSSNRVVCYNCRKLGHVKPKCPDAQKKIQPKWKKNKPRAMIGTWSEEEEDEEEENSEDEDESKICLMARESSNNSINSNNFLNLCSDSDDEELSYDELKILCEHFVITGLCTPSKHKARF